MLTAPTDEAPDFGRRELSVTKWLRVVEFFFWSCTGHGSRFSKRWEHLVVEPAHTDDRTAQPVDPLRSEVLRQIATPMVHNT